MKWKIFKSLMKERIGSIIRYTIGCAIGGTVTAVILRLFNTRVDYLIYGLVLGAMMLTVQLIFTAICAFKSSSN